MDVDKGDGFKRYTLTGLYQGFGNPPWEPPPDPPPVVSPKFGVYPGDFSDDQVSVYLGPPPTYPQLASFYWQLGTVNQVSSKGRARAEKGISTHYSIAPKDSPAFPTGARDYMNGLVNGTPQYVDYFTQYLQDVSLAVSFAPVGTVPSIVFAMTEPEVQRQQGNLVSLETFMGSTQGCMERVGAYHQAFFNLARIHAPNCLTGIWLGGYSGQYSNINFMLSNITSNVDRFGTDPYANSALGANSRPRDTWKGRLDAIQTVGGSHNAKWVALGSPPVIIPETGVSTAVNSDSRIATWISNIREDMAFRSIERVLWFNSNSGQGGNHEILNGSYPLSAAAFGAEVRQIL
jgi:hypothetical protein